MPTGQLLTRRAFLGSGLAATAGLFRFSDSVVAHGVATEYELSSAEGEVNLGGGHRWTTWMYNQQVPGPVIRARQGERLRVTLANRLAGTPTTLHWHGVPVPNQMDGVPGLTQDAVVPGEDFVYEFDARVSGTYLYHSHVGLQLDRGLAGALVIDPTEPDTAATREVVLLLDDWLPGSPDEALAAMQASASGARGSSNQGHSGASGMPRDSPIRRWPRVWRTCIGKCWAGSRPRGATANSSRLKLAARARARVVAIPKVFAPQGTCLRCVLRSTVCFK